jgi:phosphoglycolate phosphatase-like HAD superfamily hydrolase
MASNIGKTGKITAVALDFDGVITSLDIDWHEAIRQASAIADYDVKSLLLFYEEQFGKPLFEKVSDEMEKLELESIKRAQLLPYVKESVTKLFEKGVDLYIVSMQTKKVISEFLNKHELSGYFKSIVTRDKCSTKKAQVEYVLKSYNISPNQLLLVDDLKRNIVACSELGVVCFHFQVKTGFLWKQDIAKEAWNKILATT